MYKPQFRSKTFLKTDNDVLDQIDWMDDGDELRKYYADVVGYDLESLINELDRIETISPYQDINDRQKEIVQGLLAVRLGLGFELHYMLDMLSEEFQAIQKELVKLNDLKARFEKHRHCLDKTYGETPVW